MYEYAWREYYNTRNRRLDYGVVLDLKVFIISSILIFCLYVKSENTSPNGSNGTTN